MNTYESLVNLEPDAMSRDRPSIKMLVKALFFCQYLEKLRETYPALPRENGLIQNSGGANAIRMEIVVRELLGDGVAR